MAVLLFPITLPPTFSSLFIFSGDRTVSVYDNRRQGTQSGRPDERPGMRDTPRQQKGLPWGCSRFMTEPRWLTCRMQEGGGAKESHGDALYRTKNQSKTSFFVCEWLLQDCRPTNHVMTPLASPRAKARTHLGAATCLGPADATPPWGRLYKSRSLGPACPGLGASSVLSSALRPPSSARIRLDGGQRTTTDWANERPSNTPLVPIFPCRLSTSEHVSAQNIERE